MDMTHAIDWSREALRMALLLGGPLLAAALLVGLLVNVGQTLTQLHEPVVGLIPRLVAVALVLLLILPWLMNRWVSFAVDLIGSIPSALAVFNANPQIRNPETETPIDHALGDRRLKAGPGCWPRRRLRPGAGASARALLDGPGAGDPGARLAVSAGVGRRRSAWS